MFTRTVRRTLAGVALIIPLSFLAAQASAQPQPQTQPRPQTQPGERPQGVGGSIASMSDGAFVLTDRNGRAVTIRTTSATRVVSRQQASLADIHAGDLVRIVADKAQDGTLTARFVQDMASAPQAAPDRGGTWQGQSDAMMITGSVTGAPAAGTLVVTSANGQKTSVTVPSSARVSRLVSQPLSTLAVGARVLVRGTSNPDGSVSASVVLVGGPRGK